MKLKRITLLPHYDSCKIRARQRVGTMKEYYDEEKYLCFDEDELEIYIPRKRGRKPKNGG